MEHLNTKHSKTLVRKTVPRGQQYPSLTFRIEFEHAKNKPSHSYIPLTVSSPSGIEKKEKLHPPLGFFFLHISTLEGATVQQEKPHKNQN